MPRSITVPREGSAPQMRIETVFGIFKETDRLIEVAGLEGVIKLSGSGYTGSIGITVADINGNIKLTLDAVNVHKTKATIYQDIITTAGVRTSVALFRGEVSSPIVWNPNTGNVTFDIVAVIEAQEIGFSLQQSDFNEGEIIPGLKYPNGTAVTKVPASLEGKSWPVVFGSCVHVPPVGFTMEEDTTSDDPEDADKLPEGIVASEEWFPIEPSFVAQYIASCRSAMDFVAGQKHTILKIQDAKIRKVVVGSVITRTDSYRPVAASAIESSAKAWASLVQLNKKIRRAHSDKVDAFQELQDHIFTNEWILKSNWEGTRSQDSPKTEYSTYEYYREFKLHSALSSIVNDILQANWPSIALEPGHGLRRGQDPTSLLLPGDQPNTQYYRIKNAKIRGHIVGDVLIINDIVATYTGISIQGGSQDPTMFKVSVQNSDELDECEEQVTARAVDLNGMFLKVSVSVDGFSGRIKQLIKVDRHVKIPKKDGNGAIQKDDRGNILYQSVSEVYFTPIFMILDSDDTVDSLNPEHTIRDFRVSANLVLNGTIEEAAPFVLPSWGLNSDYHTSEDVRPIMVPDNWIINELLRVLVADSPDFSGGSAEPLKTIFKMGSSGFTISNGDSITEFFASRTGSGSCDEDDEDSAQAWTWICNVMHNTVIKQVFAYRTYKGRKIFTIVPSRYFYINDSRIIAGQDCTVLEVPKRLSQYENEGWDDQLYVTMTSPVGPNTSLIAQWLISEYSDYLIDATSFDATELSLSNYPSHFAILTRKELLSTLEDIAFQCRCAVYVSDQTLYMVYLAKKAPATSTIDSSNIIEGSITVELSVTEQLVTKLTGLWKPNYQDLDALYKLRPLRRINLRNNIDLYGVMEHEREFWIYNIKSLVVKSMQFWLIRWSNTWKRIKFDTTLEALTIETQDTFNLDLFGVVSTVPVDVIAESIIYDSENLKLRFDAWTPVRAGEMTPFDLAYLA